MSRERDRAATPADTQRIADVLRTTPLFKVLGEEATVATALAGPSRRYAAGQYICYQGDPGDRLYVVVQGLVKIVFASERGDEMVLNTMGTGEIFGELALLTESPRSASAIAVEPTHLFMLPRVRLVQLMGQHPALADELLRMLGQLVLRLTEQVGDLAFLDLAGRLAKRLLQLAEKHGQAEGAVLDRGLTQSDLASMIGASRPAVNRALQALAARGLITLHGHTIELRDAAGLRRRAELR
jgi:CRP/FNR family transcriptional regulator, cyclic AMP receptor protein